MAVADLERETTATAVEYAAIPVSKGRTVQSRLLKNRAATVALVLLVALHVLMMAGPLVWRVTPEAIFPDDIGSGYSTRHPLGVDEIGRDQLARLLHGGRVTLMVGLSSVTFSMLLGTFIGSSAAFFGGTTQAVLMRFTDAMMAIPSFFLTLVAITVLGKTPAVIVLIIGLTSWMSVARVVYGETLKHRSSEYVEASVASGATSFYTLRKHVLPQCFPSIIVSATLGIAWAVLTESAISYLGMGIQAPVPSWGNMLQNAQQHIWTEPSLAIIPGLSITLVVLCYNFLGDGLRDALDPRMLK